MGARRGLEKEKSGYLESQGAEGGKPEEGSRVGRTREGSQRAISTARQKQSWKEGLAKEQTKVQEARLKLIQRKLKEEERKLAAAQAALEVGGEMVEAEKEGREALVNKRQAQDI